MSESALTPQIAQPGNVLGLRVVRAAQNGDDVQLRMFVDAGTTLTTKKSSQGLVSIGNIAGNLAGSARTARTGQEQDEGKEGRCARSQ